MTYGTSLGIELPGVGDEVEWAGPLYAQQINDCIQAIMDRVETKVTQAGFDVQGHFDFNGYQARELEGVRFDDLAEELDPAAYPRAIYFKDGDAYVNDGFGQTVRLITGGALDVSSASGITGSGYGASGVEIAWDSGGTRYRLKDGAGATDYADLEAAAIRMASGSTGYFGILTPRTDQAADVTWTLPAALPGSTSIWTVTSAGQITLSRALSIDSLALATTLGVTGAATLGSTLAVTGAITAGSTIAATGAITSSAHISAGGGLRVNYRAHTGGGNVTLLTSDCIFRYTGTGGSQTISLPATPGTGQLLIIWESGPGSTSISGNGKNIDGAASIAAGFGSPKWLYYNGTEWNKIVPV